MKFHKFMLIVFFVGLGWGVFVSTFDLVVNRKFTDVSFFAGESLSSALFLWCVIMFLGSGGE